MQCIILGDFNLPNISWSTLTGSSPVSDLFCDFVFEHNLFQLVTLPTHQKGNILDLVLTDSPDSISTPSVISKQNLFISSDHFMVSFTIPFSVPTPNYHRPSRLVPDYSRADWTNLIDHMLDLDFSDLLSSNDVNITWNFLKDAINNTCDLYIPIVLLRTHQRPQWFTPEIQHSLNKPHSLRRKCRKASTPPSTAKLASMESSLQKQMTINC